MQAYIVYIVTYCFERLAWEIFSKAGRIATYQSNEGERKVVTEGLRLTWSSYAVCA